MSRHRSMPSMADIARYWSEEWIGDRRDNQPCLVERTFGNRFHSLMIGWGEPFCFGCGWLPPVNDEQGLDRAWSDAGSYLYRAHIVPNSFGGEDAAFNLIPLCAYCHSSLDKRVFSGEIVGYESFCKAVYEQEFYEMRRYREIMETGKVTLSSTGKSTTLREMGFDR